MDAATWVKDETDGRFSVRRPKRVAGPTSIQFYRRVRFDTFDRGLCSMVGRVEVGHRQFEPKTENEEPRHEQHQEPPFPVTSNHLTYAGHPRTDHIGASGGLDKIQSAPK